jgi:hypothetical protein
MGNVAPQCVQKCPNLGLSDWQPTHFIRQMAPLVNTLSRHPSEYYTGNIAIAKAIAAIKLNGGARGSI